jgi:GntR family transcriptional regulator
MQKVDANRPVPLYYQLREIVRQEILSGVRKPGDQLPTEKELEQRFGVSRVTVRQALRDLMVEGLLVRQRGRGTFVATPKLEKALKSATGFTTDMVQRGLEPGSHVLEFAERPAAAEVADGLTVPAGTPVIYLKRLRLAGGEPLALQWSYLPAALFPGLLAADLSGGSLYEYLQVHYGVSIMAGRKMVEGVVADRRIAQALHIPEGAPMLRISGTNLDQSGEPVEYGVTLYRADKYKFYVDF